MRPPTLRIALAAGLCLVSPLVAGAREPADAPPRPPNVLLVVLDDVGTDMLSCYGDPRAACTPELDLLAKAGVRFTRAYVDPVCSPTRAELSTGRYGFRTGVGIAIEQGDPDREAGLRLSETTLAEHLGHEGYDTALVGKWHLRDFGDPAGSRPTNPNEQGFRTFRGSLDGFLPSHSAWPRTVDGVTRTCTTWSTTRHTADLLITVAGLHEPWLTVYCPNAPHFPYELPPVPSPSCPRPPLNPSPYHRYQAMLSDLDHQLGFALAPILAAFPTTWVIVIGDNGTPAQFDSKCPRGGKASVYEGGIRVPLLVWGPGVVPGVSDDLVGAVDVVATVCELAGLPTPLSAVDSISFAPVLFGGSGARRTVYAEYFRPNGLPFSPTGELQRTVLDERWKLIRRDGDTGGLPAAELFDLAADPCEGMDLLQGPLAPEASAAYERLQDELALLSG